MASLLMGMLLVVSSVDAAAPDYKMASVLHIVFDDFRPDLPFYGQKFVHAPNLNSFAEKSLVFDRAYCQIAVCSPSRNSFMTGRRPNTTLVWNFFNSFREAQCPDSVAQAFSGPVLRNWTVSDAQESGGAGGCCTSCFGEQGCAGWVYKGAAGKEGGTCSMLSSVTGHTECPAGTDAKGHALPCISSHRVSASIPKFTTLPEHFKNNGFLTLGVGKLYHDGGYGFGAGIDTNPAGPGTPPLADPISWSNTTLQYPNCTWSEGFGQGKGMTRVACPGLPTFVNAYPKNNLQNGGAYLTPAGQGSCDGVPNGPYGNPGQYCTEAVPDTGEGSGPDGSIDRRPPMLDLPVFLDARNKLEAAAANQEKTGQRFFLEVGIKRPHLVWRVPQGYVDKYYNPKNFTPALPQQKVLDESISPIAWVPFFTETPHTPLSDNKTRELRRHYYSAITWADYCAGQVLGKLDELGIDTNTIVIAHADHGWHLGEYNMWEKRTVWELGTRVPFIVHVPWLTQSHGKRSSAPVELIDVFPTLSDLAGLVLPSDDAHPIEGVSLRPLLEDPSLEVLPTRSFALSTYPRCPREGGPLWNDECIHDVERSVFAYMAYSIRTVDYRYTEHVAWDGATLSPDWDNVQSRELYDHRQDIPGTAEWEAKDAFEDKNHVQSADPKLLASLAAQLRAAFGKGGRPQF